MSFRWIGSVRGARSGVPKEVCIGHADARCMCVCVYPRGLRARGRRHAVGHIPPSRRGSSQSWCLPSALKAQSSAFLVWFSTASSTEAYSSTMQRHTIALECAARPPPFSCPLPCKRHSPHPPLSSRLTPGRCLEYSIPQLSPESCSRSPNFRPVSLAFPALYFAPALARPSVSLCLVLPLATEQARCRSVALVTMVRSSGERLSVSDQGWGGGRPRA